MFDGRLDNRDELLQTLVDHPAVTAACSDGTLVLAAFERFGDEFPQHLDGDFVAVVFDRRSRRLLIARDRLGVRPVCYAMLSGTFLFASDARVLLEYPGIDSAPDDSMVAEFFLSFRSNDAERRTFFRGIHALPAAHLLVATIAGVTVHRYFDFETTRSVRFPQFHDYTLAFHELFVNAVRRRLRSSRPVGISVSGGLDSAYIFCVADRIVRAEPAICPAVIGYNYQGNPGTPSDERIFVDAVEKSGTARIERIAQRSGFVEDAAADVWTTESPIVDRLAGQARDGREALRAAGAGRTLTGHWGDQLLFDCDYLLDLLFTGRWRPLGHHARGWRRDLRWLAGRALKASVVRHAPARVVSAARRRRGGSEAPWRASWFTDRFRRLLRERAGHEPLPRTTGSWHARAMYRESRLPYHVQCMVWNTRLASAHDLDIAFPYLDSDLIQFLMSIPGEVQSYGGSPRGLMREAMRGVVPAAVAARRDKGEFTRLVNEGIWQEFDRIRALFDSRAMSVEFGYVDGAALRRHLDEWQPAIAAAPDASIANSLVDLCGLELFLRAFFGAVTEAAKSAAAVERVRC